jgi:hemerythrin superfamily protein
VEIEILEDSREKEILERVRKIEGELREIRALLLEIRKHQPPMYQKPTGFVFKAVR